MIDHDELILGLLGVDLAAIILVNPGGLDSGQIPNNFLFLIINQIPIQVLRHILKVLDVVTSYLMMIPLAVGHRIKGQAFIGMTN